MFDKYLVGIGGYDDLDNYKKDFLEELGYVGDDVQKVILQGVGPILSRRDSPDINPKYYSGFQKLEELIVEDFVDFYSHIAVQLHCYSIDLLELDAVQPIWQQVGLTYPGIGEYRYLLMAESLFNLLEKLLPTLDTIVKQCLTTLVGSNHNGFLLLCNIMGKLIPVFCPYIPSNPPKWHKYHDVAHMAKLWKLHFRLLSKNGGTHTPIQQSLMFLQSLSKPTLAPHITSICGQIQKFT